MKKPFILAALAACTILTANAQSNPLTISGYVEGYYVHDFAIPVNNLRPSFTYNHTRHNEVNLNLGLLKAAYATDNVRANLGLMVGTYAQYNLAAESEVFRNVYEANVGVKLSRNSDFWLDAGIFASHIGWESAIGKDNWTLTRSIAAENSPYYEAGAKVSYTTTDNKLSLSGMVLNGWQRIQRPDGNRSAAFGTQVTYKPSASVTLNSSTFIGNDKPEVSRQYRYFHNFYGIFQLNEQVGLILGFDAGAEQTSKESDDHNTWYSPAAILRYKPSEKVSLAGRTEYYSDENGVIVSTGTPNGFKTWGYSANVDYSPYQNMVFRLEGKVYDSKDAIFTNDNSIPSNSNSAITAAIAVSF
ncbi:porin [Daejeonella oryzae]|uniref:porin n=1 Tax=Daejeonella oryzae TaxID=1122943 RepID=UPI0004042BF9|nr:porin [Daejeonella oryzae]